MDGNVKVFQQARHMRVSPAACLHGAHRAQRRRGAPPARPQAGKAYVAGRRTC